MKKSFAKFLLVSIMLLFAVSTLPCYAADESAAGANNFNVVFVIDGSGSILSSDSQGLRYDAIDLFLGLLPQSGNNAAGIVFDDTILEKSGMIELDSISDKKEISNMFRYTNPDGYTDIGLALHEAVDILESRNPDLPSVIILLSDGNTLLSNKKGSTYTRSESLKSSALQTAQKNGYKVYGVCLNADGKASIAELSEISSATNGKCFEIKSASDLKKIFSEFYSLIYSSETSELLNSTFPGNGVIEKTFTVPSVGVDELNILLECGTKISRLSLMQPSGVLLSDSAISDMTISGDTFSVTKIANPLPGEWTLSVTGVPGENIRIQLVINNDISFISQPSTENTTFGISDTFGITAQITSKGVPVTGLDIYDDYNAVLILKKGSETQELSMMPTDNGYTINIGFGDFGTYYATPKVVINNTELYGDTYVLGVGNTAPAASVESVEFSETIWFFKDNTVQIDLSQYASDKEDTLLQFSVDDVDSEDIEYSLDGSVLTIKAINPSVTEFSVTAADSLGLSCSFNVVFSALSSSGTIVKISAITIGIILLIIIICVVSSNSKRFDGQITVQAFDDNEGTYDDPHSFEPIKRKLPLKSMIFNGCGINVQGSSFHATSKGYIIFKSSKGFYVSGMSGKQKKYDIGANTEVVISPEENLSRGIRVTFAPNDYLG